MLPLAPVLSGATITCSGTGILTRTQTKWNSRQQSSSSYSKDGRVQSCRNIGERRGPLALEIAALSARKTSDPKFAPRLARQADRRLQWQIDKECFQRVRIQKKFNQVKHGSSGGFSPGFQAFALV